MPQEDVHAHLADIQQRAIETAAFGMACVIASELGVIR
jgi:hypothetical protein